MSQPASPVKLYMWPNTPVAHVMPRDRMQSEDGRWFVVSSITCRGSGTPSATYQIHWITDDGKSIESDWLPANDVFVVWRPDPPEKKKGDSRYPHVCPWCGKPAYIGFLEIDCSGECTP